MRNGTRSLNIFSIILLVILVILFHRELFIIGVRVYAAITDDAESEILLGGYYRTTARQNEKYSNVFYQKALNKYLKGIDKTERTEKAETYYKVGRAFECARGTRMDLEKAKFYYLEAKKSAADASNKASIEPLINDGLQRVDDGMKDPKKLPECVIYSEHGYLNNFFDFGVDGTTNGKNGGMRESDEGKKKK